MDKVTKQSATKVKQLYDSAIALGVVQVVLSTSVTIYVFGVTPINLISIIPVIAVGVMYILFGRKIKIQPDNKTVVMTNAKKLLWISGIVTVLNVLGTIINPAIGVLGIVNTLFTALVLWYAIVVVRIKEYNSGENDISVQAD